MKFGQQLQEKIKPGWKFHYIDYNGLKQQIKERTTKGSFFEENDEAKFVENLEAEMQKVLDFRDVKVGELTRHVQYCEEQMKSNINGRETALESEISKITSELSDLATFTRLNYTGLVKILKKHDKHTHFMLKPMFMIRLKSKPFFLESLDNLVYRLSKLFDRLRRGNVIETPDANRKGENQVFVRKTTKYWVHPDNVAEVKCTVLKYLPVLVFSKDNKKVDPAISSVYLDNDLMDLYTGRIEKTEGAEAIRLRWYGSDDPEEVFVERKTHREDWTGEISCKERFLIKEKHLDEFMRGEYSAEDLKTKLEKDGKSEEEIEKITKLASEVQNSILTKNLKPKLRTFYNRTAFQLPADASVRISLDTELTMIREDIPSNRRWRRKDFLETHPFTDLSEMDACHFPYAILEVKLQTEHGANPPAWVDNLVSGHLVEEVPKFSKFIHGCSILYESQVNQLPFWLPQMDIDIRKAPPVELSEHTDDEARSLISGPASHHVTIDMGSGVESDEKMPLISKPNSLKSGLKSAPKSPEKKIAIPVRVEPKVFFANERTFLSWVHFSIFLGGISTALVGLGNENAKISGYLFALVSIMFSIYALYLYQWRAMKIRQKDPGPYDDRVGPTVVVVVFLAAMVINIIFSISEN